VRKALAAVLLVLPTRAVAAESGGADATSTSPQAVAPAIQPAPIQGASVASVESSAPSSAPSSAQPSALAWRWGRFSAADYVVTGTGAGITLAAAIIRPRAQHSLSGGVWFDENVRGAVRPSSLSTRYIFRDISDVGVSFAVTWPFIADALTIAWWYRGSRRVAQEMSLINLETLAVAGAIQGATNVLVSRERPYGRNCGTSQLPSDALDCEGSVHYRSFFSGHSAFSFTGAALVCIHHFKNELLGPPWDALSCAGGYTVATTTAAFRVVSDVHYASDVLTGALVGTLVGYGVPLLHYRENEAGSARSSRLQLRLVPAQGGLGVLGIF